jgi:thiol-disulfide isomerase/thioredoxin
MNSSMVHPSVTDLLAVAEGTPMRDRTAVLDHAAECEGCGALLIALAPDPNPFATNTAPGHSPREKTAPVGLATLDRSRSTRRRRVTAWLAAAASVAALVTVAVSTRPVSATTAMGTMQFTPAQPIPGERIEVVFRGGLLGSQPRLRLRADIRKLDENYPDWALPKRVVANLVRRSDGTYRGDFILPRDARYAVFAVEDSIGSAVDANGGRLWELFAYDSTRTRPTLQALLQKAHVFYARNRSVSFEAARMMRTQYPNSPRALMTALSYEQELVGPAGRDSLLAEERVVFRALDSRLRAERGESEDVAAGMLQYAEEVDDSLAVKYWATRLEKDHPRSRVLAMGRMWKALQGTSERDERLRRLETLWHTDTINRAALSLQGFVIASQSRDASALKRWGERLLPFGPAGYFESPIGGSYAELPALAGAGAAMMRKQLARFGGVSDSTRPLGLTVVQAQREHSQFVAGTLLALGRALRNTGRVTAAADTLVAATRMAWRADMYGELSDLHLAIGDTIQAARAAAFASADPSISAKQRDGWRARFARFEKSGEWAVWERAASDSMRARLAANGVRRHLPGIVRLVDAEGKEQSLESLVAGKPTVFAFWSRWCGGSLQELPDLQRVSGELARMGVRLVAVTTDNVDAALLAWMRQQRYSFPVFQDKRGEAGAAFQPYGTPDHILVDGDGVVRFERLRARELPAYGALLAGGQ